MILWTIQDPAVWEVLQRDGRYTTPSDRIEFPPEDDGDTFHGNHAYRWLAKQMEALVGPPPSGVEYPVWAWYKQQGRPDGKPDMRSPIHWYSGKPCVRMKLDVPDWEVLLSDFDGWHLVLNYCYASESEADSDAFDAWYESLGVDYRDIADRRLDSPELALVRSRIEDSWTRVLGVHQEDEDWGFPWEKRSIQATFWELRREHVLSVEHFISR